MNPQLRNFLINFVKQAIVGVSTTITVIWQDPAKFNLNTGTGWEHVGIMVGSAVLTREALVWGPKILAWANSPTPE